MKETKGTHIEIRDCTKANITTHIRAFFGQDHWCITVEIDRPGRITIV